MTVLPSALLLIALDLGCRFWYGESLWKFASSAIDARSQEHTNFRTALEGPDAVVGYLCIPGTHKISLVKGFHRVDFRATIGADGYRITHTPSERADNRPGLWIFGCSFTWGWGVNDEETFPWLVQARMPQYRFRNLAGNGYGNIQALLQLRSAVSQKERLPKIAVVVYDDFHLPRNVAAASYLSMMRGAQSRRAGQWEKFGRPEVNVPAASVDPSGQLAIGWMPLFHPSQPELREPSLEYQLRVTQSILDEFLAICRGHGITPVFAIQSRPDADPMLDYAQKAGFATVDISVDMRAGRGLYRLYPVDPHPNARAHALYAAKLLPALSGIR